MKLLRFNHVAYNDINTTAFSMHTHNHYELILFKKGNASHVVEDRKYKLNKNDLIIIRPATYHFIQIEDKCTYERFNLLFVPDTTEQSLVEKVSEKIEVVNLSSNPIALEIFSKLDYYEQNLERQDFEYLCTILITELFYNLSVSKEVVSSHTHISATLRIALDYINQNLTCIENIQEVCNALYITPSYLFRLFKNELKTSPKKYLLEKRLIMAQNMLILGGKPTKVYEECGFNDYTAFYKNYIKFFGHSPSKE